MMQIKTTSVEKKKTGWKRSECEAIYTLWIIVKLQHGERERRKVWLKKTERKLNVAKREMKETVEDILVP